jgi:outer membrane protein, heavy metal efflux system
MPNNPGLQSCLFVMLVICASIKLNAQDTIHLKLQDAEKIFIKKNLSLLAQRYNIDVAKSQVIQAKLYNNPNFVAQAALYNPEEKKFLDVSSQTGQYAFALQQMIILAGKRNKQIKLAETNVNISEDQFYTVLRTLHFSLRSDFYNLYYSQNSLKVYDKQISSLAKLDSAYHQLQEEGVVTQKDALRIRSLLYSLRAEQVQLQNQVNGIQSELQLLLRANKSFFIAESDSAFQINLRQFTLQELIDTAFNNRSDLAQAKSAVLYSQQNYSLQKSLRVPDLSLGAQYDKRGSYVDNASLINAAIDLPFFNRNQGNIKSSKTAIEQSKILLDLQTETVENDVRTAYSKALNTEKLLQSFDPKFREEFEKLLDGVILNFQKKNISLVEFTDFYDAYKTNVLQFNQLQNDRMQAIEALNYAMGKILFSH